MKEGAGPDRSAAVAGASSNLAAMGDGHRARRAGQPRDANPWDEFRPERDNWDQGWMEADRQMRGHGETV